MRLASMTRIAVALVALAAAAAAAGPAPAHALDAGRTLLVSRPGGLGALPFDGFASSYLGAHAVSADGTKVVFASESDALSLQDDNRLTNVFLRNRTTGQTTLISRGMNGKPANSWSSSPAISADGMHVAFASYATNLVSGDSRGQGQVYVVDLADQSIVMASVGPGGQAGNVSSDSPALDADGSRVAFTSWADDFDSRDDNTTQDVYLRDVSSSTTFLVSAVGNAGAVGDDYSSDPSVSDDGQRVAFESGATNITGGDGSFQSVVHDVAGDTTMVVSVSDGAGGTPAASDAYSADISGDGTKVVFVTDVSMDPDDDNQNNDAYVRDLAAQTTTLASRLDGAAGQAIGTGQSVTSARIGADGTTVGILADALSAATATLYLRSGASTTLSGDVPSPVGSLSLSGSTGTIAFGSFDAGLAQAYGGNADAEQVYVREGATTDLVSRPSGTGSPATTTSPESSMGTGQAVSADGRYVVFLSRDDHLAADDDDAFNNVFRRDMLTNETILVSRGYDGIPSNGDSSAPSISADGTRVAFRSRATNLVPGDGNALSDVFVRDIPAGTTLLADHDAAGAVPLKGASDPVLSADGSTVAYSTATALDPAHDSGFPRDVYVQRLADPAGPILASRATGTGTDGGNSDSQKPSLSADGRRVAFDSYANDLVAGDDNGGADVFVRDLDADTTVRASVTGDGGEADGWSRAPSLSEDGSRVAFTSDAANLGAPPSGFGVFQQAFVRDLRSGRTTLVSRADGSDGAVADSWVSSPEISGDGSRVAFTTPAPSLAELVGAARSSTQIYVRTLGSGQTVLASRADGMNGVPVMDRAAGSSLSRDGSCVAFVAFSMALEPGLSYSPDFGRVHLRVMAPGCSWPRASTPPPDTPPATPPATLPAGKTAHDRTAPQITDAKLSRSRARRSSRVSLSYTLSETATVRLRFARVLPGRRSGTRCVKPRHGLTRRCTQYVPAGWLKAPGAAGIQHVGLARLLGKPQVAPGRYRLTIEARDPAGNVTRAYIRLTIAR